MKTAPRKILVTNALPYANGPLHLGHMVGYIQADIWVRMQRMQGESCFYICGSDSHGTPIMIQAEKLGMTPEALVAEMQQRHATDFNDFLISFDEYYTTHSPENQAFVETIYERHLAANNISKHTIQQAYDPIKEMFLPDRYIKGECPKCSAKDQYGDSCEVCGAAYTPTELKNPYSTLSGTTPIEKESEHYFFDLPRFEAFLKDWTKQGHLQPEVANKLDEWFESGLKAWDISRDAPYFGFKIPNTENKYFYVWLDAPVGYMASFKHLCDKRKDIHFDDYWKAGSDAELYHFIGKDIVYFHALFWPAVLHGAGYRTPSAVFANGFLTIDGQKMSKSRGTFIKARTYLDYLQPEYLRYYFAAKLSDRTDDLDLNFDDFTQRVNADLIGKYINIASRTAPFIHKFSNGKLSAKITEPDLYQHFIKAGDEIAEKINQVDYSSAIRQIMSLADLANQYIDEKKPWSIAKNPEQQAGIADVCSTALNLFRWLTIYLKPVLPTIAAGVENFLNIDPLTWEDKNQPLLKHSINTYEPLMTRIDPKNIAALKAAANADIEASTVKPVIPASK